MQAPAIYPLPHTRSLSKDELQRQINKSLTDGLTGRIHVTFQKEKTLTLFTHQGRLSQLYIRNHRVPDTNWEFPLVKYGRGDIMIESVHPRGLMYRKIALERLDQTAPQSSFTSQLKVMFDLAERNANPTLFHILWKSAEGYVLVAGRDIQLRHSVMVTAGGGSEGSSAMEQVTAWKEAECNVTVHRGNIQSQAWFEVHLNILLEYYCSRILSQYGQLTGRVMIRAILWKIQTMAVQAGWNIETLENRVSDATLFPSAREAGDAYKKIISEIVAHIEPVIGPSLTQNILMQSHASTRGVFKTIAEAFDLLGVVSL